MTFITHTLALCYLAIMEEPGIFMLLCEETNND